MLANLFTLTEKSSRVTLCYITVAHSKMNIHLLQWPFIYRTDPSVVDYFHASYLLFFSLKTFETRKQEFGRYHCAPTPLLSIIILIKFQGAAKKLLAGVPSVN